jgi:DNA adenine methylase
MSMRVVAAAEPPAAWIGGKRLLSTVIIKRLECLEHETYAEPFIGMGGVFLRRSMAPSAEVINDINGDVVNLFRILQRHYVQFMDTLRFGITSRADFDRLQKARPETLTDLERAARFLYLQRLAFGGKSTGQNFGVSVDMPARFDVTKLAPALADIHERLAGVVIECLNYADFIARYDRPATLFYLDPPYWDCESDYGKGIFGKADFTRLAEQLGLIDGGFLMSINDTPEIRQIFAGFEIEAIETTYSVGGGDKSQKAAELLISGGQGLKRLPELPFNF